MDAGTMTITTTDLDKMMSNECQCESAHMNEIPPCSVEVVAMFSGCLGSALVCQAIVTYVTQSKNRAGAFCRSCHRPLVECWKVVPI